MSEYYVVMRENNPKHPLLGWRQKSTGFAGRTPIEIVEPIKLGLSSTAPKKYEMVDYHSLPEPVVSEKIRAVLIPINIYGIQLIPVTVEGNKGEIYDYWFIYIYNEISCMDKKKSDYTVSPSGIRVSLRKLVLDEEIINSISLEKRLIFELSESTSMRLFHKSIRDAIMAVNPVGIKFVDVDDWGPGSSFE